MVPRIWMYTLWMFLSSSSIVSFSSASLNTLQDRWILLFFWCWNFYFKSFFLFFQLILYQDFSFFFWAYFFLLLLARLFAFICEERGGNSMNFMWHQSRISANKKRVNIWPCLPIQQFGMYFLEIRLLWVYYLDWYDVQDEWRHGFVLFVYAWWLYGMDVYLTYNDRHVLRAKACFLFVCCARTLRCVF